MRHDKAATKQPKSIHDKTTKVAVALAFFCVLCGGTMVAAYAEDPVKVTITGETENPGTTYLAVGDSISYTATCDCGEDHDLHWTGTAPGLTSGGSGGEITLSGDATTAGTYTISASCTDHGSDSATLVVFACDDIQVGELGIFSINETDISVSATVYCQNEPAPGLTVTFTSSSLTFTGGNTATTDANGVATVTATASGTPSAYLNAGSVTASVNDGVGTDYTDDEDFTLVEVNNPTPVNPTIVDGGYSDNSVYAVVLTFTVSPAISGVPVTIAFESGEGQGVEVAAALEDASTTTNGSGEATVRVRSSDLRETATVKCTYGQSSGSTDVEFVGIASCPAGE